MKYGKKLSFEMRENNNVVELSVSGIPKGINITPMDFGRDLARRMAEGVELNPAEEIDVVQGIDDEFTTGEDVKFIYREGNKSSAMILVGVLAKKVLGRDITARASEVGGISTDEKNGSYIQVALQKMAMEKDSLGGVVECSFPWDIDIDALKADFSSVLFQVIPEASAVEFGHGIKGVKESGNSLTPAPKRISVSLLPERNGKVPCLATTMDVVIEAIANVVVANR